MATASGRSRTVLASGSFAGLSRIVSRYGIFAPYWEHNFITIDIQFLGCFIRLQTIPQLNSSVDPIPATRRLTLEAWTGPGLGRGDGETDEVTHDFDSTDDGTWDWQVDLTGGTWEISCNGMEEFFDATDTNLPPSFGGAAVPDVPNERRIQFYDKFQIGKEITVTAGVGGMSVTASTTVDANRLIDTNGNEIRMTDYPLVVNVTVEGRGVAVTAVGVANAELFFDEIQAELTGNLVGSDGTHTASVSTEAQAADVYAGCGENTKKTVVLAAFYPRRDALLTFGARAMEGAYPDPVDLRIDKTRLEMADPETIEDGDTLTITQEKHSLAATFYNRPGGDGYNLDPIGQDLPTVSSGFRPTVLAAAQPLPDIADDWTPLRMWITPEWIAAAGEQQNDWRFPVYGLPFSSFTLVQASEMTVTSTLASGTGATDLTISLPTVTTAAGLKGTSFAGVSLRGYRYLRLRMKASVAETVTVTIGSKQWNQDKNGASLALTTSYQNFDIDLCSPTNATSDTDSTDTSFPLPTTDGAYWGVSAASSLVIGSISGGVTVDVESVKVVRDSYSRTTFLQPFPMEWVPAGDTSEYPVRMIDGDTDGRRSHEAIHAYRPQSGGAIVSRSLTEIIGSINGAAGAYPSDGFTATAAGSFPDAYHTNSLDSCFVWGGGMLYVGSAWSYGFDQSVNTSLAVKAQPRWDVVDWMPCMGDLFAYNGGAYTETAYMSAGKILRGQAVGLVLRENAVPASGVTVEVEEGASGSGVTGTDGAYQTGADYVTGGTTQEVRAVVSDPFPAVTVTFPARKRKRACFRVLNPSTSGQWILQDRYGKLHLAAVLDGDILYFRSGSSVPNWVVNGAPVTDGGSDSRPVMILDWRNRIVLVFERGGDTYETTSDDDGLTWSTPTVAISGGTLPFIATDEQGNMIEAAYVGGAIQARYRAKGDTSWSDVFTLTDDADDPLAVENDIFCLSPARESPGRWTLAVVIDGESATSLWWSADEGRDGMSWTRFV